MTELEVAILIQLARRYIQLPDPKWDAAACADASQKTTEEVQQALKNLRSSHLISGHMQPGGQVVGRPAATPQGIRKLMLLPIDEESLLDNFASVRADVIEYLLEHGPSSVQALQEPTGRTSKQLQPYLRLMGAMGHLTPLLRAGGRITSVSLGEVAAISRRVISRTEGERKGF
ncbi:hypothetical protein ACFFLM_26360 [Deinococcus oregonensis]|uniref:Transcriptional regulator n=1 Tax=Deinococcus oregonensis TaxID=1805970 RepID=A0ABV6B6R8_9DEIO